MFFNLFCASAPPSIDPGNLKIEINEEDDRDLQFALHRSRKLQQSQALESSDVKVRNFISVFLLRIFFNFNLA